MFSPLAFPAGLILYDLSPALPPSSHSELSPFELYREPLIVIGVADGTRLPSPTSARSGEYDRSVGEVAQRRNDEEGLYLEFQDEFERIVDGYPRALVHRILLFDHVKSTTDLPEALVAIPSPEASNTTTMKTVMCDLTSQLLADMTTYAKSLQAFPTIHTPRSEHSSTSTPLNGASGGTAYGSSPSRPTSANQDSRSRSPAKSGTYPHNRMSMPVHMPSASGSRAATPDARPLSPPGRSQTPPTTFDEISGARGIGSPSRSGITDSRQQSKDRVSVQGFGAGGSGEKERIKGKGRVGTVIGAMYLLAGRWPDALKELVESATIHRANSDYIWLAKALDYILVTLLMYAWAGMDFKVPQILYPGIDRTSKSTSHRPSDSVSDFSATSSGVPSRLVSLQNLTGILPDLVNNMINLYIRAWTFTEDKLPAFAFSESIIRFSKLLTVVELSQGNLDDQGLQRIVLNVATAKDAGLTARIAPFPSKAEITTTLFRAFPSPMVDAALPVADRIMILAGIASVLSELGYHRKKAIVLRELVSALLPALVQARKDGAAEMGVHPAASLVTLSAAVGNAASQQSDSRIGDSEYGMRSFLSLLCSEYGVSLSGIPSKESRHNDNSQGHSQRENSLSASSRDDDEEVIGRILHQAATHLVGAQILKLDVLRACINLCEALPDLEGVLQLSADTLRTAGSGIAPGPDSSDGSPSLPVEDQVRLSNNMSRTLGASQQLGYENLEAEYWDEFLVRGIELADVGLPRKPTPHAKGELDLVDASETKAIKNPFIYNPFGKSATATNAEPTLVAEEEVLVRVTLQNLYDFDLEVERIMLETSGAPFDSFPQSVLVGPYRTQTMSLTGVPRAGGLLQITGCKAKIKGCRERRFPSFSNPWSFNIDVKTDPREMATISQNATLVETAKVQNISNLQRPIVSRLQLNVIDVQPNVVLESTSLPQSATMLLEGETKTFSVTLQNLSSAVPADFLLVSFKDSTATQLQSALASKDLKPAELYELELSAIRNQSFKWLRTASDPEPKIDPGGSITLEVEVFGKPGLSHGSILVDFGYLGVPKSELKDRFYTRQLVIPLAITVNASVELIRNDLISLTSDFAWQNQQRQQPRSASSSSSTASTPESQRRHYTRRRTSRDENTFSSLLSRLGLNSNDESHCLLLLDVRNSWPNLLTTSIQVRQNPSVSKDAPTSNSDAWKRAYTVHETQQPGHTSRLVLILPRFYLSNPYAPIPSLNPATKRQYVVNTAKDASPEAELAAREAFWYREELLNHIRATWREDSTGRKGVINLRSLRLSARMIPALKLEDLDISLSVGPCASYPPTPPPESRSETKSEVNSSSVKILGPSTFALPTSTFLTLTTTLYNRTAYPIHPLLRLQSLLRNQTHDIALDLTKRFCWNGVLQRALPVLSGGERRSVSLDFCVLCKGTYEVGASVEEVRRMRVDTAEGEEVEGKGTGDGADEEGDFASRGMVDGTGERRVWYAGEPCVIIATEPD